MVLLCKSGVVVLVASKGNCEHGPQFYPVSSGVNTANYSIVHACVGGGGGGQIKSCQHMTTFCT